jgi:hypothetical protein
MAIPAPVAEAIKVLQAAQAALEQIMKSGHATWVLVPGDVTVPEETKIIARWNPSEVTVQDPRDAVVWPQVQYQAWRAAWEILVGYAGWWGKADVWPLGDGARAVSDRVTAGQLPPIAGAYARLQAALLTVLAPTWKPDIHPLAVVAPLIFVGGAIAAWCSWRHRYMLR